MHRMFYEAENKSFIKHLFDRSGEIQSLPPIEYNYIFKMFDQ